MMIDSHQHFWSLARGDYPWPDESVAPIFRDFGPQDLIELLETTGISQTVLVQATDSIAETDFLLDIADQSSFVKGVLAGSILTIPPRPRFWKSLAPTKVARALSDSYRAIPQPPHQTRDDRCRVFRIATS